MAKKKLARSKPPLPAPPEGAPNVVIVLLNDMGVWHSERLWRLCRNEDNRAARQSWTALQPISHIAKRAYRSRRKKMNRKQREEQR